MEKELQTVNEQQRVSDLRHLYRSLTRMIRSDAVDTLLNHIVEDIVESTSLERMVVLYYNQQNKMLESRVFYGFKEIQDIHVPFGQVNGLLKRAYADREPLNVLKSNTQPADQDKKTVKCGIFKDDYTERKGSNRRRHINVCFKDIEEPNKIEAADQAYFKHYSVLTYYKHDQTVESLIGNASAFLIIPICEENSFYGYVLADKPLETSHVSYEDARIASSIVAHSAMAIGRAMKQREMMTRIAKQNEDLSRHLEENEQLKSFYESIFQSLRSGLITADKNLNITHLNKAAINLLGFSPEEILGTPLMSLFTAQKEEIREIFAEGGKCIDPKTGFLSEFKMVRKDREPLPTEVCFSIIHDKSEEITGLSCIFLDITQRKKMEKHLARMDRLASLGELASGIAHEIRNPLAGIGGALQILSKHFDNDNSNHVIFKEVLDQVLRLDDFVKNLLQFARPSTPKFESLKVEDVIDSTLFLVSNQISKKQIKLNIEHERNQPDIQGDKNLLQQVFLNITINALDAMEGGGTLGITIWWDQEEILPAPEAIYCAPRQDQVIIKISDTGPGIKEEDIDNIFNPFFTTKSQGTGLGLSITHRIIEQHHGTISVDSNPDTGTTFTISLPIGS